MQLQIRITAIARRQTPAPGGGVYEWVGSGPIIEHDAWRATVGLGRDGLRQAREALIGGRPYQFSLMEEDIVEFSIE